MTRRLRVVAPVLPLCQHFERGQQHHQCGRAATLAILSDEQPELLCGAFCHEHADPVLEVLVAEEPEEWYMVPIMRGNPFARQQEQPS